MVTLLVEARPKGLLVGRPCGEPVGKVVASGHRVEPSHLVLSASAVGVNLRASRVGAPAETGPLVAGLGRHVTSSRSHSAADRAEPRAGRATCKACQVPYAKRYCNYRKQ